MQTIQIKTLIDITKTKNARPGLSYTNEMDQYKNFITLLQCIELRSVVGYDNPPTIETINLSEIDFGKFYSGEHKVWTFTFRTDRNDVYMDHAMNPLGQLIEDIHGVPIIKSLTETINIDRAVFDCKDIKQKNTIVQLLAF